VPTPIVQSATFLFRGGEGDEELLYTRYNNNPNQLLVGRKVAALEGMEAATPLASGMAATATTLLALTQGGDHIVASRDSYGSTRTLMGSDFPKRGVETRSSTRRAWTSGSARSAPRRAWSSWRCRPTRLCV
jgi:cystathionine beta-lyase